MSTPLPERPAIRVLIVDDHLVVRSGLRMLLESHPGLQVVGEAGGRAEAMAAVGAEPTDIVLLDLDLGGESGLDFIPELLAASRHPARVLVLTGVRDSGIHQRALRRGAMGVVLKDKAAEVLIKAIERVQAGEVWVDRLMMGRVLADLARTDADNAQHAARIASLTDRERDVLGKVAEGLSNKHIAGQLFISETTVRHHLTSIFSKLEVSDRLELLVYAYRHRLVQPPPW